MQKQSAIWISLALIISSVILAFGLSQIKKQNNFVTVKGLSEKEVKADKAWWSINTQIAANTTEDMQRKIQSIEKSIRGFLKSEGFSESEMKSPSINVYQNNYQNATARLSGDFRLAVVTEDIEKVQSAQKSTGDLISQGILIQTDQWSAGPKYYFTKFKSLKKDMLAEATKEAKAAAQEFANNSGSAVGKIRRANQGVFQILPGDRTNENEMFTPDKIVRVVSTVDYYLK